MPDAADAFEAVVPVPRFWCNAPIAAAIRSRRTRTLASAAVSVAAPRRALPSEVYARAVARCEWNVRDRVRNVCLTPQWLEAGDRFWYERQLADGSELMLVDPEGRSTTVLTDHPSRDDVPAGRLRSPDGASGTSSSASCSDSVRHRHGRRWSPRASSSVADVARRPLPLAPRGLDESVDLTMATLDVGL